MMEKKWWHGKVAYQIYPKSFLDTNGDGIGDLRGIIHKLDYLKSLGIDILWISPIYESPFVDQGYDISDYYKISPVFGTMEEFDELLKEAQKRDIKIVMDLVINHCSDQHVWFQKAIKDPFGEYGKYFYFREGKNGKAPSNARSYFGGSIWEPVPGYENLFYLHMFAKEQPDLNWHNQAVLDELYKMIRFWLEKGVAGFRIDAIINIQKDLTFPDFEPDGIDGLAFCTKTVEAGHDIGMLLEDLKKNTFDSYQAFTVGEVFNMDSAQIEEFVGENGYFSTMFDFGAHLLTLGEGNGAWYTAPELDFFAWRKTIKESQKKLEGIGFLANILENHDEPRCAETYLPDYARDEEGLKMLAAISMCLRGIPFIYQGQEIGMRNLPVESVADYNDINTIDQYETALSAGCSVEEALEVCYKHSRDNARTPMQWDKMENAGFTTGKPWFHVNPNYKKINVEDQLQDKNSIWYFYQELIALRKNPKYSETLTYGRFDTVLEDMKVKNKDGTMRPAKLFAYKRYTQNQKLVVLCNFDQEELMIDTGYNRAQMILAGGISVAYQNHRITLPPKGCAIFTSNDI